MNPNDSMHNMTPEEFKQWLINASDNMDPDSESEMYDQDGRLNESTGMTDEQKELAAKAILEYNKDPEYQAMTDDLFIFTLDLERYLPGENVRADIQIFEETDPAIHTLKEKYGDFYKWNQAMQIWEDHMNFLIGKYGNYETVVAGAKEGFIPDIVPPCPRLKKTKKNRRLLRMGVSPNPPQPVQWTHEQRMAYYDTYLKDFRDPDEIDDDEFTIILEDAPKKFQKMYRRALEERMNVTRKRSIHKKSGRGGDTDLDSIMHFMNSKEYHTYDSKGNHQDELSITEMVEREEKYSYYQEEVLDDRLNIRTVSFVNGRLIKAEDQDAMEVYDYMISQGFAEALAGKKGLPKRTQRMVRNRLERAGTGPLTEKQIKRLKKEQKKFAKAEKRRKRAAYAADVAISKALGRGETFFRDSNGDLLDLNHMLDHWTD